MHVATVTDVQEADLEAKLRLALLTAAAVAALTMTATAGAHIIRPGCNSHLAARAELRCARFNYQHALATVAWAQQQQKTIRFLDASMTLRLQHLEDAHRWLARVMAARVAEAQRRIAAASFPAHHLLWLCIHGTPSLGTPVGHEASRWDTRAANGHYGGLQMHPGWGYGTSFYASDDSQIVQEHAAETAYQASGYSPSFLTQQWGQTISPCWKYASG